MSSTRWQPSTIAVIAAAILLPPVGLVLLWMRRDTQTGVKVFGSLGIVAVSALYLYIFLAGGLRPGSSDPNSDAHYTALERQRAEQRANAPESPAASNPAEPPAESATPSGDTNASPTDAAAKTSAKSARTYWTDFRGPARDGRYDEASIRTQWPAEGLPLMWKQPIGGGYASFVVAEGVAFTIEQRRGQEVAAAYDVETGRELWTHGWDANFVESMGGDGPRATPTWEAGRLYVLGAVGDLRCLDARTGKLIWSKNILSDNGARNLEWGMSGAPLVIDDKVIVLPGGMSGKSVVAYNKLTGAPVWRSLNDRQAYSSPMLGTLAGKRQIIVVSANRVVGLEIGDGSLLWEYPWNTDMGINAAQPVMVDQNRFFISAGYGKGAALVEVSSNGSGFAARKIWENNLMKNKFNSSVLYNGHVYGLDEGILTCLNVETGERKWKGGRYGYGQLLLAGGHLVVISEQGELVLVKATPDQYTELAKFPAIEGKTWNYPAIAGNRLLVRNQTQMACFNLAGK